ncbi:alkaline phosphatase family protein [Mycolicibacterium duvalii]|uniref:Phosphodiesterase n=1 Tax=Mycolicibacterium duvalii TaxID=39688 RepID=A0A7I7JZ26_9MYCO|nr:nucleotide pyrophosphatase/phosphodiesterase family protein [Mycolicibacterium duvalii]MCV7369605.1 alkaline phosphatase family protein [Mycolicibacterium duvalii]PEG42227.1 alkaline phosphatase family protein [Mycolicibacterium duvalii]BBX16332.1 phosphodiesterase [Mycolicibacterium duvalii]
MDLPQPDPDLPHLADVAPALLTAMGVEGFESRLQLPGEVAGACVLLIDGLGADLLQRHAADAPVLSGLRRQTLQVGFPSTTAAGLAAVGTGCRSGEHGMVGMSFLLPDVGLINALRWRPHPWGEDLRSTATPETVQPRATVFERAAAAGVSVSVISGAQFTGSGLTRAVLRGGRYIGVHALGDLAAAVSSAVADRGFCYAYHADLDLVGHIHGPGSPAWRLQLRQVDRLVESVVDELPPGGLLAVVADHGMIGLDPAQTVDVDTTEALQDGVAAVGGEVRARHLYVRDGALDDVLATWRAVLGPRAWVVSRDDAISAGWFGPRVADDVRARIGDVVAAARDSAGVLRRTAEPIESSLIGQHGSLTDAEQRIPFLLAVG